MDDRERREFEAGLAADVDVLGAQQIHNRWHSRRADFLQRS